MLNDLELRLVSLKFYLPLDIMNNLRIPNERRFKEREHRAYGSFEESRVVELQL